MKISTVYNRLLIGFVAFSSFYVIPTATAQVIPDNTLPNSSIAPRNCTDCEITGGTASGGNLFHSFEQFSVPTGGRAFFNNATDVQNIFTRITGRSPSNVDGTLQTNGTANLFLLNPNGIIFGRNASLNIGGSFFATTGDRINFADGTQFSTINPQPTSLLTISAPIGLQLGQNAGSITNRSQASVNGINTLGAAVGLQVPLGEAIAFIGNGIFLENGNLTARGGRVELHSLAASEVNLAPIGNSYTITDTSSSTANIRLSNESNIDTSGEIGKTATGGVILLRGNNIRLFDGTSLTSSTYQGTGGNLQFIATESLSLNASFAGTFNEGEGRAGNVIIRARDSVNLIGNPRGALGSQASRTSTGDAGDILINTQKLSVQDGFRIEASTFGRGNGGDIRIQSDRVEVIGSNRQGIDLNGDRNIDIPRGQAPSGIVSQVGIRARDDVGDAGNLSIATGRLVLRDGGFVSTATFASGSSGNLNINATESIDIQGATPAVTRNQYRSGIYASSEPGENSVGQLIPTTGSVGTLNITTDRLTVADRGEISANNRGTGFAGSATLNVRDLQILNGGEIRASSLNSGDGGTLIVNADSIQLTGSSIIGSELVPSSLAALARSSGQAGNLEIATSSLDILNGAEVSVSATSAGAAGDLFISADRINLDRGRLSASTQAIRGGNIFLGDVELLTLRNNSTLSARAANQARGGNITARAPNGFVLAAGENNDIIANAFQGRGGNIIIQAQSILGFAEQRSTLANLTNDIDASSEFGAPGSVTLNQIDPDPSRGTVELPADIIDASSLVAQTCSARGAIARTPGEFIITGRGGLSPSPIEQLGASSTLPHWIVRNDSTSQSVTPRNQEQQSQSERQLPAENEIVEAQGWVKTAEGEIMLVTESPAHSSRYPQGVAQASATQISCNR